MLRFGSLFAGIGGLDLGLERARMECVWQVEIDDYCTRVLEKHWPDVRRYRNVREVGSNLEPVDLIAGGFPCQPHSVAGKRKGAADDRNLWPEFIRVIRETKPRYVLAENVPGIITTYLDTVLSDLEGENYATWPFAFSACGFDAPHIRERIFVVAYSNGTRELQPQGCDQTQRRRIGNSGKDVGYAERTGQQSGLLGQGEIKSRGTSTSRSECQRTRWTVEPNVGRVAHGIPSRVDRLRGLGNAVVPQVAEWIGRRIMEHNEQVRP